MKVRQSAATLPTAKDRRGRERDGMAKSSSSSGDNNKQVAKNGRCNHKSRCGGKSEALCAICCTILMSTVRRKVCFLHGRGSNHKEETSSPKFDNFTMRHLQPATCQRACSKEHLCTHRFEALRLYTQLEMSTSSEHMHCKVRRTHRRTESCAIMMIAGD